MDAHPRIEQTPISAPPIRVALDRYEWVALFPDRTDRGDQRREVMLAGEFEHPLDGHATEAVALGIIRNLDQQRTEHVRAALVEAARDGAVDARW